jgi:hypothetical protein
VGSGFCPLINLRSGSGIAGQRRRAYRRTNERLGLPVQSGRRNVAGRSCAAPAYSAGTLVRAVEVGGRPTKRQKGCKTFPVSVRDA